MWKIVKSWIFSYGKYAVHLLMNVEKKRLCLPELTGDEQRDRDLLVFVSSSSSTPTSLSWINRESSSTSTELIVLLSENDSRLMRHWRSRGISSLWSSSTSFRESLRGLGGEEDRTWINVLFRISSLWWSLTSNGSSFMTVFGFAWWFWWWWWWYGW